MNSPAGSSDQKKAIQALETSPLVKVEKTKASSRQFCFKFNDCLGKRSAVTTNPQRQQQLQQQGKQQCLQLPTSKFELQVTELENEVQKQREIQTMYRKRMETTQDYLRYCLQIAQQNGFLDLIINKNKYPISSNVVNLNLSPSTQVLTSVPQQSDLDRVINQAQINGWYIDPAEIELQERIGRGSTADIYRGIWRGFDVAVKCINPEFFHNNENGVAFFAQEVETLSRQRHRFILQLMGACLDPPTRGWVVTEELCMTLHDWLHGAGNNRRKERVIAIPPFEERLSKALEISQAMQYLHEQKPKVIHRDLKPSNIFLDDSKHVRVADFGHARFLADEEMAFTGETGTYVYMAPEVIRCEPYDEKCDVYMAPEIALEVGEGKLRPALPENDEKLGELIDLICLSWDEDASVRPTFADITSALKKIQYGIKENV